MAQGDKNELLAGGGTVARARDGAALRRALELAGLSAADSSEGLLVQADAEAVGQAAADAGIALAELRPAGSGGLEQLFLTLTAGESTKEAVR